MPILKVEVGTMSQGLQGPLEAETDEEADAPRASRKEERPADTLRLAQRD